MLKPSFFKLLPRCISRSSSANVATVCLGFAGGLSAFSFMIGTVAPAQAVSLKLASVTSNGGTFTYNYDFELGGIAEANVYTGGINVLGVQLLPATFAQLGDANGGPQGVTSTSASSILGGAFNQGTSVGNTTTWTGKSLLTATVGLLGTADFGTLSLTSSIGTVKPVDYTIGNITAVVGVGSNCTSNSILNVGLVASCSGEVLAPAVGGSPAIVPESSSFLGTLVLGVGYLLNHQLKRLRSST